MLLQNGIISFLFLWLSNIPLYMCTTTLSIHLFVDFYTVFTFYIVYIVNSAAKNIGVHASF